MARTKRNVGANAETVGEAALREVFAALDAAHARDPRRRSTADGEVPAEALWCATVARWLERLRPDASPALRVAARAQHLERWRYPRSDFPAGRAGYLRWRREAARAQAEQAATLAARTGFDAAFREQLGRLLRKEGLGRDPEVTALEDAACLAFLELDLADFAARHDDADVVRILQRTWRKMSPAGRAAAAEVALPPEAERLVTLALESGDEG